MDDQADQNAIRRERIWKLVTAASGLLGAMLAKRLLRMAYRLIRKAEPASAFDSQSESFSWPNVFVWALAAGIGLVFAKIVSKRVAAIGWKAATGSRPPLASGS